VQELLGGEMEITINLTERQVVFLKKMVLDGSKYEGIKTIEEAINECVNMALYEDSEHASMQ
jgi:hypothetical protein